MSMPSIDKIMAFEEGTMEQDEVVEMFQDGIDNGRVWQLQGFYGRTAMSLIAAGLCHQKAKTPFNEHFAFVSVGK